MKKILAVVMAASTLIFDGCSEIKPVVTEVPPPPPPKKQVAEQKINLPEDKLQELFLQLAPKTTKEEVEAYAVSNGLYVNKDRYDYKIAFRESDAYFKRGTSGDAVTITFNKNWTLDYGEYFHGDNNCHAFVISGATPEERARYMFRDDWNQAQESVPTAISALRKAVSQEAPVK